MKLSDAHNHLHDPRLAARRNEMLAGLVNAGLAKAVVNGTCENDWAAVSALAAQHPFVVPSFGLHPWFTHGHSPAWLENLACMLAAHPGSAVGEIGLDRGSCGSDFAAQQVVFDAQLRLASSLDLPVTIHCVRAWGTLREMLTSCPLPARGFLLHGYAGPAEMLAGFVKIGGYFSFNASFLHARNAARVATFARVPLDRLLVETDAPNLTPPRERNSHPLRDPAGLAINHPGNLTLAYEALAALRGLSVKRLARHVEQNFTRFFLA